MNLLWSLERAFVKDLLLHWPVEGKEKLPNYNTVSTVVRILEEKAYVSHEAFGRSHQYYALVSKREYQKRFMKNAVEHVFSGSLSGMISSLLDNQGGLSATELNKLRDLIDKSDTE